MGDSLSTQLGGVAELELPRTTSPLAASGLPVVSDLDGELRAQSEHAAQVAANESFHKTLEWVSQKDQMHWFHLPKEKRLEEIDKAIEALEGIKKDKKGFLDHLGLQDYDDNFQVKLAELKQFRKDNANGEVTDEELAKFLQIQEAATTYSNGGGLKEVAQFMIGIGSGILAFSVAKKFMPNNTLGTLISAAAGFAGYEAGSTLANGTDFSKFNVNDLMNGNFSQIFSLTDNAPYLVKKLVEWCAPRKP